MSIALYKAMVKHARLCGSYLEPGPHGGVDRFLRPGVFERVQTIKVHGKAVGVGVATGRRHVVAGANVGRRLGSREEEEGILSGRMRIYAR